MRRKLVNALGPVSEAALRGASAGSNGGQPAEIPRLSAGEGKIPFTGHKPPGRWAVYYYGKRKKRTEVFWQGADGDLVCVNPGRDEDYERHLRDPGRNDPDPIYLTFTVEPVRPDTHRAVYRRGDILVTPPARVLRRRLRMMERAHRARFQRGNRHPRSALRDGRAVYRAALTATWGDFPVEEQRRREDLERFLRSAHPPAKRWRWLAQRGVPPVEMLFTPLDYVPKVGFTKRQRRCLAVVDLAGELARYMNSLEGAAYREEGLAAQARGEPLPVLDIPLECREGGAREDPRWFRRYDESCLLRKAGARLSFCGRCRRYVFAIRDVSSRCPAHSPA